MSAGPQATWPEWRDIKTAPKDGSRILASVKGRVIVIWRNDPGGAARNPKHHYECWVEDRRDSFGFCVGEPDGWLPLPTPLPPPPVSP